MNNIKYRLVNFEGMWICQRISDGKIIKRVWY